MVSRSAGIALLGISSFLLQAQRSPVTGAEFHEAMSRRDFSGALIVANHEIALDRNDGEGWFHKGLAQHALHQESEALISLNKARSLAPQELRYAEAAAQLAYLAHEPHALDEVNAVLHIDPESAPAHGMAGVLLLEAGQCSDASQHLLRPTVLSAINDSTRLRLADCLEPSRPAVSVQLLEPLRTNGSLSSTGYSVLGQALADTDKLPEAVEELREGCQRFSTVPALYADLAILSMDHQSPEVALGVLDAGIRAVPNAVELYTLRGSVYAQLAQNDKASADFETADRLSPGQAYGALGLGMLLRDSSNLDEAQRRLEAKLVQLPNDPLLGYTLADVLIRQGVAPEDPSFARAVALLRNAIAKDPTLPQTYALLGKLLLRSNDVPDATRNLEKAVALNGHDRTALNQLVAAYRRAGRTADAARTSEQLMQLANEDRKKETESNRIHLTLAPTDPYSPHGQP